MHVLDKHSIALTHNFGNDARFTSVSTNIDNHCVSNEKVPVDVSQRFYGGELLAAHSRDHAHPPEAHAPFVRVIGVLRIATVRVSTLILTACFRLPCFIVGRHVIVA